MYVPYNLTSQNAGSSIHVLLCEDCFKHACPKEILLLHSTDAKGLVTKNFIKARNLQAKAWNFPRWLACQTRRSTLFDS